MTRFIVAVLVAVGTGFVLGHLALTAGALKYVVCGLMGFGTMAIIKG